MHRPSLIALAAAVCALWSGSALAQTRPVAKPADDTHAGIFHEPRLIAKAARLAEKRTADSPYKDGFFLESGSMITGAGWISLGPGYRHRVFNNRAVFSTSGALSWRFYNMAQARLETAKSDSPFSFGTALVYQDALQVNYFGLGNDTDISARTGYRLRSTDIDGHARYKRGPLTIDARAGWMPMLEVGEMAGRVPEFPNTQDAFTETTAPGVTSQPSFAHTDASATYDVRDVPGHPTSGGAYMVSVGTYNDLDTGRYSFRTMQLEGTQYVPLFSRRLVFALRAWGVFTGTGEGNSVPFYLMPNTGGRNTIRGYRDFRFSGPQTEVFSAESRWAIFEHIDAALFVDAGRVADRISDLGFTDLKHSTGVGVRFHTATSTVARFDVARSSEGWIITFKMNEPFRRKTVMGKLPPVVPFVP